MPAYRSEAEGEIRTAVVDHLRVLRPSARIIHEINACDFGNRIDVLAVSEANIVAVEIKSKKDKIDRLPAQIKAMKGVAHTVIAAVHEKFLRVSRHGTFPPEEASGALVWAYPRIARDGHVECGSTWMENANFERRFRCLPDAAIAMLWRAELRMLCNEAGIDATARTNMPEMIDALRWHRSGAELTRDICRALRRRECVEADPVIEPERQAA